MSQALKWQAWLMHDSKRAKTPRQLWVAIGLSLVAAGALICFGFLALPSLAPEYQAFWSGLIGSFVGSAVAFGGAAWLWRMERHILIEERSADREEVRLQEQKRGDARSLRDCLAVIGNLQALNFHMQDEGHFATARDKYLMRIRFDEALSLIRDEDLRRELDFISRLVDYGDALDYIVMPEYTRLDTVHTWLGRLTSLPEGGDVADARPKNFEKLTSDLDAYDDHCREQQEAYEEYAAQEREKQREAAAKAKGDEQA